MASRKGAPVPEQEQKRIQKKGGSDPEGADDAGQVTSSSKAAELKDEMDDILDEIDSVLEENAEEFVKSYVQKGGE
jgi:ubiquitin-like protein Pup